MRFITIMIVTAQGKNIKLGSNLVNWTVWKMKKSSRKSNLSGHSVKVLIRSWDFLIRKHTIQFLKLLKTAQIRTLSKLVREKSIQHWEHLTGKFTFVVRIHTCNWDYHIQHMMKIERLYSQKFYLSEKLRLVKAV